MGYAKRTKFIDKAIIALKNDKKSDEDVKLLQNGFIPESMQDDYVAFESDVKDSELDKLIYGNYFAEKPEKVSGVMIEGSGYLNPIKVKGGIDNVISALNSVKELQPIEGKYPDPVKNKEASQKLTQQTVDDFKRISDAFNNSDEKEGIIKKTTSLYGWSYERMIDNSGKLLFRLINRKNKTVAQLIINGNNYTITHVDGTKILSGNSDLGKAIEKVIRDYFYGKKDGVEIASEEIINPNAPSEDDLLSVSERAGEDFFNAGKERIPLSDIGFVDFVKDENSNVKAEYIKAWLKGWDAANLRKPITEKQKEIIKPEYEKMKKIIKETDKIIEKEMKPKEEITPVTDTLNVEPQKETIKVEKTVSVVKSPETILENKDTSPKINKDYYSVEDSVKFLNPGITDDEIRAWVWYKRLHGNPMNGWGRWYISSSEDKSNKLVFAKEETEILGNNYKPIGFVPKGSVVGLKTKFSNEYQGIKYIVCKTQQGSLIWINEAHTEEKNTISASSESELEKLVRANALIYTGVDYLPLPIFLYGNFYIKMKGIENNKESIVQKFGEEQYNATIEMLKKYKPKQKSFADPVASRRPFISCLSEFANNTDVFGITQLNEEINVKLGAYKRNRFIEVTDKISLFDAFQSYLSEYVKDTDIKNTNKVNIRTYYFAKSVRWQKDDSGKDVLSESQKAELIGNARFEAERLFSEFLATGLTVEDRMKLDIEWNIRYNAISDVNNFVHKVPVGYEGSAMFKSGKLTIKPAQREGLAFLAINGSGIMAYEVGFGKTAMAILNVAQLLSQGKVKRPLIVVPKPTYKNWLKELFGYYSDGQRTELFEFENSKYYYGILSGTEYKLNDWYNLKGKTLKRLTAEHGSEEKINKIVPEGTITIVSYQGFEQIGMSNDVSEKVFDSIYEAISQKGNIEIEDREDAKEYQKAREILGIAKKNTIVDIDKIGFDHITIDEAHNFKNAFSGCGKDPATGRKLFGIQANRSARAVKMFFITQYVQRYFGKNVVMLTATPFTNSPLEWFSMVSYVGLDSLLNYNLWNIQKFFEQFVMQTVEYTVDAKGELKVKPVIKAIQNLGLFQTILFNCIHRKDDPKEAGITRPCLYEMPNKDISTTLDMNEYQQNNQGLVKQLVNSYSKDNKGAILKALALSQNNAFSPFLAAKEFPESAKDFVENSPKINYIIECIKTVKEYHEKRNEECSGQVIYSNRGVEYFEYIKEYLNEYCGFRTNLLFDDEKIDEVEILTGGGTEADEDWKETVKEAFNAGVVKVIIGTSTIKEGVNLQERGTAIYLALPEYNPSDIQQLKGRIWRQGNMYGYVRFVAPLVVNSMDAFIWQKIEEKTARLGSIWIRTESNTIEMQSELSPEEIKYSLVESVEEKLKIKLDGQQKQADYDFKLAKENLETLVNVTNEISELSTYVERAKTDLLEKLPVWIRLQDIIIKKMLPEIEASQEEEKSSIKKKITDLSEKINDLIEGVNNCKNGDWKNIKEILVVARYLEQRRYDLPERYSSGLMKKLHSFMENESGMDNWKLFAFDVFTKRKITEHWSVIAKAERSVFAPYGKTWTDDISDMEATLNKKYVEANSYLEYLKTPEYKEQLIVQIQKDIQAAMEKRGSVIDRVKDFESTNHLLSYLKDNTDLEKCPIPDQECCEFNQVDVIDEPDTYKEDVAYKEAERKISQEPKKLRLSDIPQSVKNFMPEMQQKAIVGSEEHWDEIKELESIISKMPKTYQTEDVPTKEKIVWLHYFYADSDWYIIEKDKGQSAKEEKESGLKAGRQYQAFGYVILNGDIEMAEWGYINIEELKQTNKVELDFYFNPKPFGEVIQQKYPSEPEKPKVSKYQAIEKQIKGFGILLKMAKDEGKKDLIRKQIKGFEILLKITPKMKLGGSIKNDLFADGGNIKETPLFATIYNNGKWAINFHKEKNHSSIAIDGHGDIEDLKNAIKKYKLLKHKIDIFDITNLDISVIMKISDIEEYSNSYKPISYSEWKKEALSKGAVIL